MSRELPKRKVQTCSEMANDRASSLHWRPSLPNRIWTPGQVRREEFASIAEIKEYLRTINTEYHEASHGQH